jgi:TetR/AcrR family transcriptional regulator, fatty acid metabolism regulator protein
MNHHSTLIISFLIFLPNPLNYLLFLMKAADKHSKIINAATKVFAKKGFFNARISDIAKEAKVADGTIYLYFNNKFDILISVFEEEIGSLIKQVSLALAMEPDPRKQLEIFATKHLTMMKKNKNLAEVIQIELRQSTKVIKEYRNNKFSEYIDIISTIIKNGQAQEIYRADIKPGIAKRAFFGALDEISRVWSTSLETEYTVEETISQIMGIFLAGMLISAKQPQ